MPHVGVVANDVSHMTVSSWEANCDDYGVYVDISFHVFTFKSTYEAMLSKFLFCLVRCNPYCEVVVDGQKGNIKTEVLKKTTQPVWDEEFTL